MEIIAEIRRRFHVEIDYSQIRDWTVRGVNPYGRVHRFEAVPAPELAYVIGVKLGDATQSKGTWQHTYMIKLLVIDKEFAEEFSYCASKVLRCNPFKVWRYEKRRAWCTTINSIMLYEFLEEGLPRFKRFVEHCNRCAASFPRGFFDSEASVSGHSVTISNGNLELLNYVQRLLRDYFRIETTGPHRAGPAPGVQRLIKGRLYNVNKQLFALTVRTSSLARFESSIGFRVERKKVALPCAVSNPRGGKPRLGQGGCGTSGNEADGSVAFGPT